MSKTQITATPDQPQIVIERSFAAPRDLVFKCYTDPELIPRWLGPHGSVVRIEEYDVRDGGRWRYVDVSADGGEYTFHGIFHGTPTKERTVQTFEFEGVPGHVSLETITMEEREGRTHVRTVSIFQSVEDRDGMVASGMESGVHDSDERLAALLEELQR